MIPKLINGSVRKNNQAFYLCLEFNDTYIEIKTDVNTAIVEFERLLLLLRTEKQEQEENWKQEYETRQRFNQQAEITEGFAGEPKPSDVKLDNYKFFE